MKNILEIDDHKAVITFDPEIDMFRGEFLSLNGGADFYADNVEDLKKEGRTSLKVYLEMCKEKGIEPFKNFSGKFNIRIPSDLHEAAVLAASSENKSLNEWVKEKIEEAACL